MLREIHNFSAERTRLTAIAAVLYYERLALKNSYVSSERHKTRAPKAQTSFTSNFEDETVSITVTPASDSYSVSVNGGEAVSLPKVDLAEAVMDLGGDIVQPIKMTNQNVAIQFEGTVFNVPIMPANAFEAEKLMPEKPKEVKIQNNHKQMGAKGHNSLKEWPDIKNSVAL